LANSVGYHEDESRLRDETKDRHRALASMMEELEAADWYDQRVDVATDAELREILVHNRDEEKEHFVMTLEWLRRRDPKLDAELRERLFSEGSIVAKEEAGKADGTDLRGGTAAAGGGASGRAAEGSLGIGSLRGGGPSL
jgi:ferritin-like protein